MEERVLQDESTHLTKLKDKLREMFQLDRGDLDFGIYRIMNQKRDEVERFLDADLLPQVRKAFEQYQSADKIEAAKELEKAIQAAQSLGVDPETTEKVKELRATLAESVDVSALEQEVYSDLYNFFRRYYHEGDFISLRRYKADTYAIPYEGEEVKLYWANHDQYYIKTSENLKTYAFKLPSGKRVRFELAVAGTEQDNIKAANGKERRFILHADDPVSEDNGELVIHFEYRPDDQSRKQDGLIAQAVDAIINLDGIDSWILELTTPSPTEKKPDRTLLEKHLTDYTAKNTFDYFIHKDLGGFLRRELDFFIKNEVMHLDDIENESVPRVEQYLSKLKALRKIAHKIIAFLEQLENFQKKLWLKMKFVLETHYCVTLVRVPDELYPEIAANDAQREEWVRLFAIDEIEGYSKPLTVEFLETNDNLVLDTKFFDETFTRRITTNIDDLDSQIDGLLIHSENFQALQLLQNRYRESVKCIYIDPPYNTASSAILYKNDYRHSSWCTLMRDRVDLAKQFLKNDGALFVSIDKAERTVLEHALDDVFGPENHIEELIWTQATANSQLPNYSTNHEYVEVYARNRGAVEADAEMFRELKPGFTEIMRLVKNLGPEFPSVEKIKKEVGKLFDEHIAAYRESWELRGGEWGAEAKRQDPWKGLYNYINAEYRDCVGKLISESDAKNCDASIWVWREMPTAAPASKQSLTTHDPDHHNFRYYKPLHPITGKPCPHPRTGWKFPYMPDPNNPDRRSFVELDKTRYIAWGEDESKIPATKGFLHEVETNIGTSVFYEYNDGEAELTNMFGESGLFLSPKSSRFVKKFVAQTTRKTDWFIDFFGGSGSSGHAVIAQNREDGGDRKQVLVEVGQHFDTLLLPRMKKACYSSNWQNGKPTSRDTGISHMFKYMRLESYEDALDNLELKRTAEQQDLLDADQSQGADGLREEFLLSYMLDVETRESPSLLNIEKFKDPWNYELKITRNDETKRVKVDLVETFNWLLGLRVKTMSRVRDVYVVTGLSPQDEKVLILWRKLEETDNEALDKWFGRQQYNTREQEYDLIYVNGDNHLENLRKDEETWKVRLIEQEFKRLMFDVRDV